MRFKFTSFLKVVALSLLASPFVLANQPNANSKKNSVAKTSQAQTQTININKADAGALEALPGIGPALASRIVTYREANGPFKTVDSITQVKGIGPKMLEKLRPFIALK